MLKEGWEEIANVMFFQHFQLQSCEETQICVNKHFMKLLEHNQQRKYLITALIYFADSGTYLIFHRRAEEQICIRTNGKFVCICTNICTVIRICSNIYTVVRIGTRICTVVRKSTSISTVVRICCHIYTVILINTEIHTVVRIDTRICTVIHLGTNICRMIRKCCNIFR